MTATHARLTISDRNSCLTPAFIYDEALIRKRIGRAKQIMAPAGTGLIFAVKSLSHRGVISAMNDCIDGFAVSSLFEARLVREFASSRHSIHLTAPGLNAAELPELVYLCDHISVNSLSQFRRFGTDIRSSCELGIRVNPRTSFVSDPRCDPCRQYSKLGVGLETLSLELRRDASLLNHIGGLHFHANSESRDFRHLLTSVRAIIERMSHLLRRVRWVNIGGGYLFDDDADWGCFSEAVALLQDYNLQVFFEPGKGIVGSAGYIMASVLDMFETDGKSVAILDTSVNHMPEVFEYQYSPTVLQESPNGRHRYILAGCTCMAGDVFGEYGFAVPLQVGDRVVFEDVGAYSLVKASTFNGVNLPNIYRLDQDGELTLIQQSTYEDYRARWGGG